jgi:hypothetical protein
MVLWVGIVGAGTGTKATALHRLSCPSDLLTIRQFVYNRRGWLIPLQKQAPRGRALVHRLTRDDSALNARRWMSAAASVARLRAARRAP